MTLDSPKISSRMCPFSKPRSLHYASCINIRVADFLALYSISRILRFWDSIVVLRVKKRFFTVITFFRIKRIIIPSQLLSTNANIWSQNPRKSKSNKRKVLTLPRQAVRWNVQIHRVGLKKRLGASNLLMSACIIEVPSSSLLSTGSVKPGSLSL